MMSVGVFTSRTLPLHAVGCHLKSFALYTNPRSCLILRVNVHTPGESILEAHAIRHVLVLRIAKLLPVQLFLSTLFHEQDQVWIVRILNDSSEVHSVVYLVLSLKNFFEAEVVMAFFECVKCDVLVVLREDVSILTASISITQYVACVGIRAGARCSLTKHTIVGLLGFESVERWLSVR